MIGESALFYSRKIQVEMEHKEPALGYHSGHMA
jgi:hypothetical protein